MAPPLAARIGRKLLLATHNDGKRREFAGLLEPLGIEVVSAGDLRLPEPEETGATFEANAILKARAGFEASGLATLADDSGLAVRGLDGRPGIHTARWAGETRDFGVAMARVRHELALRFGSFEAADKHATFVCVLALVLDGGEPFLFEGTVDGMIAPEPRGSEGFGYDPIFIPEGQTRTFGEMLKADKAALSHRARATAKFLEACRGAR